MGNTNSSENTEILNRMLSIVTNQNLRENLSHERENVFESNWQETNVTPGVEGTSQREDAEGESQDGTFAEGTSQREDAEGTSQREDAEGTSQREDAEGDSLRDGAEGESQDGTFAEGDSLWDGVDGTSQREGPVGAFRGDGTKYEWPPVWAR